MKEKEEQDNQLSPIFKTHGTRGGRGGGEEENEKKERTVFDGSNSSLSSSEMKLLVFVLAELSGCKCRYWPIVMQILSLIAPQYAHAIITQHQVLLLRLLLFRGGGK